MKAAVLHEINTPLTIEEVQIDDPGPNEVLIRTGASGVCHSDLHFVEGLYSHPKPVVLGHEAAGTVEKVGVNVTYLNPGDPVITCLSVFCGNCEMCLSGRPNICSRRAELNARPEDRPRLSKDGETVNQFANLSSFADQLSSKQPRSNSQLTN